MTTLSFEQLLDQHTNVLQEGQFVNGILTVKAPPVGVEPGFGFVEIVGSTDGVVPIEELKNVDIGDHVFALVTEQEGELGCPVLSVRRAAKESKWREVAEAHKDKRAVVAKVLKVVKGGLTISVLDQHGFLPASQIDLHRVPDLSVYPGTEFEVLVIEAERRRHNIIVSRRALLEIEEQKQVAEQLNAFEAGTLVQAEVTAVTNFGVFCQISDNLTGLVHASEMKWGRWDNLNPGVTVGETVSVIVLNHEIKNGKPRVGLSIRLTKPRGGNKKMANK